jgi:hypothetical protein
VYSEVMANPVPRIAHELRNELLKSSEQA